MRRFDGATAGDAAAQTTSPEPVTVTPPTDEALMVAFARGDEGAFRALFQRHATATLSFLYGCTSNREAAEDLLQETFSRVCRHRDDWADGLRGGEGDSFRAWLFAIARNIARDAGRRATVRRKAAEEMSRPNAPADVHDGVVPTAEAGPDEALAHDDLARRVVDALARIPENQRDAFVMIRLKELTYEEVASALGTTVPATKMRVARATAALAEILGDEAFEGAAATTARTKER